MDLTGRHVVVTGGSGGIGAALGRAFLAAGARTTLVARNEERLRRTADGLGATYLAADVAQAPELIARLEPVDVLANNAGYDATGAFAELSAEALREVFAVNAAAAAELSRQALPGMLERGSGRIVFVSSLSARVALPGLVAYSAAKAAVSQLAEGLRLELHDTGVGVTLAEIGAVETGMYRAVQSYPPAAAAFRRLLAARALRMLAPDEVADAVVRACVRDRSYVVLPRRAWPQQVLARIPQRLTNLLT